MAATSFKRSLFSSNPAKYDSLLAGNSAFIPTSYESIATFTPSSPGGITFSSIPGTYKHLQLRAKYTDIYSGSGALYYGYSIQLNGDTSASNYAYHNIQGANGSVTADGVAAGSYGSWFNIQSSGGYNGGTIGGVSILDIIDYASTTKNKTGRIVAGVDYNGSPIVGSISLTSALWLSTAAITSIRISSTGNGFTTGCSFALYGIKG
jgi:hypothetical protein